MAKCDLSIKLDHPDAVYPGGGKVTGTVTVRADANVKCKGLEVSSGWRTHGRGNVASGTEQTETLFTGEWMAGQQEEYRFERSKRSDCSMRGDETERPSLVAAQFDVGSVPYN